MTDISFYHLQHQPVTRALPKLVEKVLGAGHRALILVGSAPMAERLDEALWTYDQDSFLPHGRADSPHADLQPVLIGESESAANGADVLVVLDDRMPADPGRWQRCLYMFDGNDGPSLDAARARWRALKGSGHSLAYWQQNEAGGWEKKG